jgi:ferrochelatase
MTLLASISEPIGLLVMAYGGPDSLESIPGYLADIRNGRTTPQSVVEEITGNYRQIGGASPLLERTRAQLEALSAHLSTRCPNTFRPYLGMRHWVPWIEETVGQMIDHGIRRAIAIVMAPHFSELSIAKYRQKIESGLEIYRGAIEFNFVDQYHSHPKLIQAFANRLQEALNEWPSPIRDNVHVVLTAHSLPARILEQKDPYPTQLAQTAHFVATACGLTTERWSFSYQSAGRSSEPWLDPLLPDHLRALSARGVQDVAVMPIGFVSDHVEILFDIDIQAQSVAKDAGITLRRASALNEDPLFIEALADVVCHKAQPWMAQPAAV